MTKERLEAACQQMRERQAAKPAKLRKSGLTLSERAEARTVGLTRLERARLKARQEELAEDRRFYDRLRFDQSKFWTPAEPRSLIPSTLSAIAVSDPVGWR